MPKDILDFPDPSARKGDEVSVRPEIDLPDIALSDIAMGILEGGSSLASMRAEEREAARGSILGQMATGIPVSLAKAGVGAAQTMTPQGRMRALSEASRRRADFEPGAETPLTPEQQEMAMFVEPVQSAVLGVPFAQGALASGLAGAAYRSAKALLSKPGGRVYKAVGDAVVANVGGRPAVATKTHAQTGRIPPYDPSKRARGTPLPARIKAFHGGSKKTGTEWDPRGRHLGSGEGWPGVGPLGQGTYFSSTKAGATPYLKYGGDSPVLHEVEIDTTGMISPGIASPKWRLLEEEAAKHLPARSLKHGLSLPDLFRYVDRDVAYKMLDDLGITGVYTKLPHSDEIVVFDKSVISTPGKPDPESLASVAAREIDVAGVFPVFRGDTFEEAIEHGRGYVKHYVSHPEFVNRIWRQKFSLEKAGGRALTGGETPDQVYLKSYEAYARATYMAGNPYPTLAEFLFEHPTGKMKYPVDSPEYTYMDDIKFIGGGRVTGDDIIAQEKLDMRKRFVEHVDNVQVNKSPTLRPKDVPGYGMAAEDILGLARPRSSLADSAMAEAYTNIPSSPEATSDVSHIWVREPGRYVDFGGGEVWADPTKQEMREVAETAAHEFLHMVGGGRGLPGQSMAGGILEDAAAHRLAMAAREKAMKPTKGMPTDTPWQRRLKEEEQMRARRETPIPTLGEQIRHVNMNYTGETVEDYFQVLSNVTTPTPGFTLSKLGAGGEFLENIPHPTLVDVEVAEGGMSPYMTDRTDWMTDLVENNLSYGRSHIGGVNIDDIKNSMDDLVHARDGLIEAEALQANHSAIVAEGGEIPMGKELGAKLERLSDAALVSTNKLSEYPPDYDFVGHVDDLQETAEHLIETAGLPARRLWSTPGFEKSYALQLTPELFDHGNVIAKALDDSADAVELLMGEHLTSSVGRELYDKSEAVAWKRKAAQEIRAAINEAKDRGVTTGADLEVEAYEALVKLRVTENLSNYMRLEKAAKYSADEAEVFVNLQRARATMENRGILKHRYDEVTDEHMKALFELPAYDVPIEVNRLRGFALTEGARSNIKQALNTVPGIAAAVGAGELESR